MNEEINHFKMTRLDESYDHDRIRNVSATVSGSNNGKYQILYLFKSNNIEIQDSLLKFECCDDIEEFHIYLLLCAISQ
jgi:hypothetical protein